MKYVLVVATFLLTIALMLLPSLLVNDAPAQVAAVQQTGLANTIYMHYFESADTFLLSDRYQLYSFFALAGEKVTIVVNGLEPQVIPFITVLDPLGTTLIEDLNPLGQPVAAVQFEVPADGIYPFLVGRFNNEPGLVRIMLFEGDPLENAVTVKDTADPLLPSRAYLVAGRPATDGEAALQVLVEALPFDFVLQEGEQEPFFYVSRGNLDDIPPVEERYAPVPRFAWFNVNDQTLYTIYIRPLPDVITDDAKPIIFPEGTEEPLPRIMPQLPFDFLLIINDGSDEPITILRQICSVELPALLVEGVVPVHKLPDINSEILTTFEGGETLEVVSTDETGEWLQLVTTLSTTGTAWIQNNEFYDGTTANCERVKASDPIDPDELAALLADYEAELEAELGNIQMTLTALPSRTPTLTLTPSLTVSPTASPTFTSTSAVNTAVPSSTPTEVAQQSTATFTPDAGVGAPPPSSDISITKTASTTTPLVNTTVTFTITVTTNGPDFPDNVTISDPIPTGMTYLSSTPQQGTYNPATGEWFIGAMLQLQSLTLTIQAQVNANTAGTTIVNTAQITVSSIVDPNTANNTASVSLNVRGVPTFTKSFLTNPVNPGANTTLRLTINNSTIGTAVSNLAFTDNLSATNFTIANSVPLTNTCNLSFSPVLSVGGTSLNATGGSVAANGSCVLEVQVKSLVSGTHTNTTSALTGSTGTGTTASASITVNNPSPPAFSKAFTNDPMAAGEVNTLTFTIDNSANLVAVTALAFTDNFAGINFTVASPPNANNTCGGTFNATAGSSSVDLSGGTVAASGICTISVDVTSGIAGFRTNTTTTLTSSGGSSTAASDDITVNQPSPPAFSKAFGAASISQGETTTLTFTIDNSGNLVGLTGIAFTDDLSGAGFDVADTPSAANTCGGTWNPSAEATLLSLSGGSIAAGATCTLSVVVQGNAVGDPRFNTSDSITTNETVVGDTANDSIVVTAPVVPIFTKAFAPNPVPADNTVSTLTFTIDNTANFVDVTSLDFSDDMTLIDLTVASSVSASTTCIGGTLTAVGESPTFGYTGGTVPAGSTCTVSVDVYSDTIDLIPRNNTSGDLTSSAGNSGTASDTLTFSCPSTTLNVAASDETGFYEAVQLANLCPDLTTINLTNSTYTFASGLDFTDGSNALPSATTPIVINGNGSIVERNSVANFRIFHVSASGDLTLNNMTLQNGNATGGFPTGIGGGILNNQGSLTLSSVTVTNNQSSDSGGGIYNFGGSLTITNSTISLNTATGDGGGIQVDGGPGSASLNMTGGSISNNSANGAQGGGALLNFDSTIVLDGVTINNNFGTKAGAIANIGGANTDIQILNATTFTANTATGGNGTVIEGTSAGITFNNAIISGGHASTNCTGGGFPVAANGSTGGDGSCWANPPLFSKAFSPTSVPAENTVSTLTFTIDNTGILSAATALDFTDNLPAGLVIADGPVTSNTCTGGTLTAVQGTSIISYSGGTVAATTSCQIAVDVRLSAFATGNYLNTTGSLTSSAGNSGTASDTLTVTCPSTPINVAASDEQGFIDAVNLANLCPDLTTINLTNSMYTFDGGLGTFAANGNNALPDVFTPIIINGNSSTVERDFSAPSDFRLFHLSTSSLTLNDLGVRFGAESTGGGIYNQGTLVLDNVAIYDNDANTNGGGIYNANGTVTIQNGSQIGVGTSPNTANGNGGGIYSTGGTVTITNSQIVDNRSTTGGGAGIYSSGGTVNVNNTTMTYNIAGGDGGAISIINGNLTVDNSTLNSNTAAVRGGAIVAPGSTVTIQNGSQIGAAGSGNSASFGGGLFLYNAASLNVTGSSISGNQAINSGGGIAVSNSGSSVTLDNTTMTSNTAQWGAAVYGEDNASVTIQNTSDIGLNGFGNIASANGGGVYLFTASLDLMNSTIGFNQASSFGGGIYATASSTVNINNASNVISNDAGAGGGGGVYMSSSTVTITGASIIDGNGTGNNGGGINNLGGTLTINSATISNNGSPSDGGGLYNDGGSANIQNTLFDTNFSESSGAAIYHDGVASLTVDSSTFTNNFSNNGQGAVMYLNATPGVFSLTNSVITAGHPSDNCTDNALGIFPVALDGNTDGDGTCFPAP